MSIVNAGQNCTDASRTTIIEQALNPENFPFEFIRIEIKLKVIFSSIINRSAGVNSHRSSCKKLVFTPAYFIDIYLMDNFFRVLIFQKAGYCFASIGKPAVAGYRIPRFFNGSITSFVIIFSPKCHNLSSFPNHFDGFPFFPWIFRQSLGRFPDSEEIQNA